VSRCNSTMGCVSTGHIVSRQAVRHAESPRPSKAPGAEVRHRRTSRREEENSQVVFRLLLLCSVWSQWVPGGEGTQKRTLGTGMLFLSAGNQGPMMRKRSSCLFSFTNCIADGLQRWSFFAWIWRQASHSSMYADKGGDNAGFYTIAASRALVCAASLSFSPYVPLIDRREAFSF
jgi:hypothetical protein